jgi:hypothetical protein
MSLLTRNSVFALLTTLTLVVASSAVAAPPKALLLTPGQPCYDLPRFGFESFNIHGVGERLTFVRWGGIASRMGLEPGDVVLSMNGYRLTYHGAWNDALRRAVNDGGWVQLTVRDVRTGYIAQRETYLGSSGPIVPHVVGYGPNTAKSHYNSPKPHFNNNDQMKKLADVFGTNNNP